MSEIAARILARCEPRGDCLVWTGAATPDGYGVIRLNNPRRLDYVHRVIYEAEVGPIPDGHTVDHVWARGCRFRGCCNRAHLEAVSHAINMQRSSQARLSDAAAQEIRRSSASHASLSRRFGVSTTTIRRVRLGDQWKEAA